MSGHGPTNGGTAVSADVMASIEEKLAASTFGKTLQDYSIGDLKLTMWIPDDLAGRVIGKKGLVIQNLQRESKTRLINALPRVGDSLWIAVVMLGEIKNVFDACKAISEIVEGEVDDVVFEFTINYRKPFFLYGGRKFGIIKRISADTNVRIFFPEFNPKEQSFREALPVSLEGSSADVRRAVGMLEREALLYQHQQALRAERLEANSVSSGDSSRRDVKTGRRAVLATKPDSGAQQAAPAQRSAPPSTGAAQQQQQQQGLAAKEGSAAELSTPDARAPPGPDAAAEGAPAAKAVRQGEAGPAITEEAIAAKYGGRQVEEFINVPTSLVGLLLSKRPKAKSTTINMIQVMTHTIISKMLPAGIADDAKGAEDVDKGSTRPGLEQGSADDADSGGDRRGRAASDPAAAGEESSCGDSDGSSESGDASDSDDDGEGAEEQAAPERAVEEGEAVAAGGAEQAAPGETALLDTTRPVDADAAAVDEVKRRAIAESERLGYVVFRVLGFHEENVRAVVKALQDIIDGERIALVCEKLKTESVKLQWPPHRQPPKWARDPSERREPRVRKERAAKPGEDGDRPRPSKVRDPLRPPKSSRLRRANDGEGDAADADAEGNAADGEVSSRYRGKNPRTREQLLGDRAAAVEKRAARGPPREPKPRSARPDAAAAGAMAAGNAGDA